MSGTSRSRPARQPNWRPGEYREVHPLQRWLKRIGMTLVAVALLVLFIFTLRWLLDGTNNRVAFAALTLNEFDAGELPTLAFADADRRRLSLLKWSVQDPIDAPSALKQLAEWPADAKVCVVYISAHVAVRPVGDERHVCLLAREARLADLDKLLADGKNNATLDVRDALNALAKANNAIKLVLIDAPRAHAEPWLAALARDWTETLRADVDAVNDPNLWVVTPADDSAGVSRIHYNLKPKQAESVPTHSEFVEAVSEVLQGQHGGDATSQITIGDFKQRVTKALGRKVLLLHAAGGADSRVLLEKPLANLAATSGSEEAIAQAQPAAQPAADKKSEENPTDAPSAWEVNDQLWDYEQKLANIGPVDYAPDHWRKLQSIMVWHDWASHTGSTPPDAPYQSLVAAQLRLAGKDAVDELDDWDGTAIAPFKPSIGDFAEMKSAWEQAPPGYRFAVRRRNLLAARVPEYWRWMAACGRLDRTQVDEDLLLLRNLSEEIEARAKSNDRFEADGLREYEGEKLHELFVRVTSGLTKDEVTRLCNKPATLGNTAPLEPEDQFAIEQLLLTSLPSAADRKQLWKTLKTSEVTAGPMTRSDPAVTAQAELEAKLISFTAELAEELQLSEAEQLQALAAAVAEAVPRLSKAEDTNAPIAFAQSLGAYYQLLDQATDVPPSNQLAEAFLRGADALVPRASEVATLASAPEWQTLLDVSAEPKIINLAKSAEAEVVITLRPDGTTKTPRMFFTAIPAGVRIIPLGVGAEFDNKPLATQVRLPPGTVFRFKISVPRDGKSLDSTDLLGAAEVTADSGEIVRETLKIEITPPALSRFKLALTPVDQRDDAEKREGPLQLRTFPQEEVVGEEQEKKKRFTDFDLGVRQLDGPSGPLSASLYALGPLTPGESLPATFAEFDDRARKLDVKIEVALPPDEGRSDEARLLKFLPPPAPEQPATAATTPPATAPPVAKTPGEISLDGEHLAVVIEELEGNDVVNRHVQWIEIQPLHPEQFVDAHRPTPDIRAGQRIVQLTVEAKETATGILAIPDDGVPVRFGGSEAFRGVDVKYSPTNLTLGQPMEITVDVAENGDLADSRFHLDIAGYPRAFMWDVQPGTANPVLFQGSRIAIRGPVRPTADDPPLSFRPNQKFDVVLEVDSEDDDCTVAVQIELQEGDGASDSFSLERGTVKPKVVGLQKLYGDRAVRNTLKLDAKTGKLRIRSVVADQSLQLDPGPNRGSAYIVAHIIDSANQVIAKADPIPIVIDDQAPETPVIVYEPPGRPLEHIAEKPLTVRLRAFDRLSGPNKLSCWLTDKPERTSDGWAPPWKVVKAGPPTDGFLEREFVLPVPADQLPVLSPRSMTGTLRLYVLAEDNATNAMAEPEPLEVRFETQSMADPTAAAAPDSGKRVDVIIKVEKKRGDAAFFATVTHVGTKVTKKVGAGGIANFPQLKPGLHEFTAKGTTAFGDRIGTDSFEITEADSGPITRTILLEKIEEEPPPPMP